MQFLGVHRWVEWFLAWKFLQGGRSYVLVITLISTLGVVLGVGVLIIVLSVMQGFERELHRKLAGFTPHLQVTNNGVLNDYEPLRMALEQVDGVVEVDPLVQGPVMVKCQNQISTPFIRGVDDRSTEQTRLVRENLLAGGWLDGPDTILVGAEWAARNEAIVGDVVSIYSPRNLQRQMSDFEALSSGGAEMFLPMDFIIVGIFRTGFFEADSNYLLMTLDAAQQIYGLDLGIHALVLQTPHPLKVRQVQAEVGPLLPEGVFVRTWMDTHSTFLEAVVMERRVMFVVITFVLLVAGLGLCSTLIVVTVEKRREIGMMKAIGALDAQVWMVFSFYGFTVGCVGATLGVAFALLVLLNIDAVSNGLASLAQQDVFPSEVYQLAKLPVEFDPAMMGFIWGMGILLSSLAAMLPAWAATWVQPASALRND